MKIEMSESLFYSWLRHVKECQVVQTNWKPSPSWEIRDEDILKAFMKVAGDYYQDKYDYDIYKYNSFSQFLMQAEIDALGINLSEDGSTLIYAVDVAFHESGLNYTARGGTTANVVKKLIRTALCMKGFFGTEKGDIIFASPKIHNAVMSELEPCIADLNNLFTDNGYGFTARVIANDDSRDGAPVYTSNGIGDYYTIPRIFARPEVVIFTMFND